MSLAISLLATPAQTLQVSLNGQPITLTLSTKYSTDEGVNKTYIDIALNDVDVINSALCRDRVMLVQLAYLGIEGDFVFVDTQGDSDPTYDGFGSRYYLLYLFPQDIGYAQLSGLVDLTSV